MPVVRKGTSPKTMAANLANSHKSTGPHRLTNNRRRLHHGILAKLDPFIMQELGEDPAEYAHLREAILNSLAPQDALEQAMGEEMVDLLWRKRRLRRGEAAQQAEQRRMLKLQRQQKLASEGKHAADAALQTKLAAQLGIVALPDSTFKFEHILLFLRDVAAAADQGEFTAMHLRALQALYGPHPSVAVAAMMGLYEDCLRTTAENKAVDEGVADEVRRNLKAEIECFQTLQGLYHSKEISIPPSLLDSRLLLSNRDSRKLNRYETTIANQFYAVLDRFMEYRRFRLTWGGTTEQALVNVDASSVEAGLDAANRETSAVEAKTEEQQPTS